MRMYNCMIVHEYCFYCLLQFLRIFFKFLPTSLVFLYPKPWKTGNQVWGWLGLLSKMMQIGQMSLSIVFNIVKVIWRFPRALEWAFNLIQLLPFCLNFFLVLNTMLEWEQCLLLERESGVKCWQRQPLTVSLIICISNCVFIWLYIL